MIKTKRYIIASTLGLVGTIILGIFLFKNYPKNINTFDILPSNFSKISYIKVNNKILNFLPNKSEIKTILTGFKDITLWSLISGEKTYIVFIWTPKNNFEKIKKEIIEKIKNINPNFSEKIEIEKKFNKILIGSKQDLQTFLKLPHNFKTTKIYKHLPQKYDWLIAVNFNKLNINQNLYETNYYYKNLDFWIWYININENNDINSSLKIYFKKKLNFNKPQIDKKLFKFISKNDFIDIIIWNWLQTFKISKQQLSLLYPFLSKELPQLNIISPNQFTELIYNTLQNFEIKITDWNNIFWIWVSIIFSGNNLFEIWKKFMPFIKQYLNSTLGSWFKIKETDDKISIISTSKWQIWFSLIKIDLIKQNNYTVLQILEPVMSNQTNKIISKYKNYENGIIFLYINIWKILNKLYTLNTISPYISENVYQNFKNSILIWKFNIYNKFIEFNFLLKNNEK